MKKVKERPKFAAHFIVSLQKMLSNKLHNTAILVFANSPDEELKHKPIAKDGMLFEELTQRSLSIVKQTKLPYFHITERQQQGNSFGERFVNAVQLVFDHGFDNIITIGNDTPLLKISHLVEAHRALQTQKTVLGPSADGGFYLLGIHSSQFDPVAFKNLPWQTSILTHKLLQLPYISDHGTVHLPTLFDLDNDSDLKLLVRFTRHICLNLRKIILFLISPAKRHDLNYKLYFVKASTEQILFNKGSPVYF
ncbi:DUF2064 domain-containing protein [Flavobacteriaceae bacterium F89]|uniref:DUF2064 domain-containing protein n=1 Tax=Cerina litoralis TaxID=2874477 RepID=A0AAE3ETR7_9FLAO|nr:DUF2064 domain-containing protein [Cerina litoralis]MCG2460947.1 DUF2064 domain-containing protein [Cerina litoralis]